MKALALFYFLIATALVAGPGGCALMSANSYSNEPSTILALFLTPILLGFLLGAYAWKIWKGDK